MTMMLDEYMGWGDDVEIEQEITRSGYDKKRSTYYFKISETRKTKEYPKFTGFWGSIVQQDIIEDTK